MGLYSAHLSGRVAMAATAAELIAGLALAPDPAMTRSRHVIIGRALPESFCRSRPPDPPRHHAPSVKPPNKRLELNPRDLHDTIAHNRPGEAA